MTKYPYYFWKDEPDDGEYELQFDRFETSEGGDRHDLAALLIVDQEADEIVGDVRYPIADLPGIGRDHSGTAIFHGTIEDSEIVAVEYDPELSEQRQEKARKRHERVWGTADDVGSDEQ